MSVSRNSAFRNPSPPDCFLILLATAFFSQNYCAYSLLFFLHSYSENYNASQYERPQSLHDVRANRQHASFFRLAPRNGAVSAHAAISVAVGTPQPVFQNISRNYLPYPKFGTFFFWSAPTIFSVYLGGVLYPLHSTFLLAIFSRLFLSAIFSRLFSVSRFPSHRLSALLRRPPRQVRRRRGTYLADAIHPRRETPRLPKAGSTAIYPRRGMPEFTAIIRISQFLLYTFRENYNVSQYERPQSLRDVRANRQHASFPRLAPRNGAVRAHAAISVAVGTPQPVFQNFFRNYLPYSKFGTFFFLVCPDYLFRFLGGVLYPLHSTLQLATFSRLFLSAIFLPPVFCQSFSSHCPSALLRRPPRQVRRRHGNYLADAIRPRRGTPRLPKAGSTAIY